MRRSARIALLALAAVSPLSCDGSLPGAGPSEELSQGGAGAGSPLGRMAGAQLGVRHQGRRRVEARWTIQGVQHQLVYLERISADGFGGFAIDPIDLVQPQISSTQEQIFLLVQKQREGLFQRYRDFQIRDPDQFASNYTATDTGARPQVLGRPCSELVVQRRQGAASLFRLTVDLETGLVLREREEALDGTLLGLVEYETLDLAPDLSGVELHQSITQEEPLVLGAGAQGQLGFQLEMPRLVPPGYRLSEATMLTDPLSGGKWAKLTYTDGLEPLFYLHGGAWVDDPLSPLPQGGLAQVMSAGPWTVVQARFEGERAIAMGRVPERALLDMIESAFP